MSKYLLLLSLSVSLASPAMAQSGADSATDNGKMIVLTHPIRDTGITVVATGERERMSQSGQPISIISRAEIEAVQGADLTRILQRLPGVTVSRNGGAGSFTGVRVRGAEAEQVLVVIDGVRVADPASPGGGFDFGNLLAGNIGKIELLRGSNSTIWGSQAIGGVLAVTSADPRAMDGSIEYGARNTLTAQAGAGTSGKWGYLALDGGFYRSDGFSAAASGTEPDGFRQWQAGGRTRVFLTDHFTLLGSLRYTDGRLDLDGFPPPTYSFADTSEFQTTRQLSALAGVQYMTALLDLTLSYSRSSTARDNFDPAYGSAPAYAARGTSERAELRGKWSLADTLALRFGGDGEWSRFSDTYDSQKQANSHAIYAQLGFERGALEINGGARLTDHSRFGKVVTPGGDMAVRLSDNWRLRASFGEGFKAPTLYQLFSDYGNQALLPERSASFDLGIEHGDRNQATYFAVSLFRRDSRNLIDFVSCYGVTGGICTNRPYGTYDNVGRARAQGLELEGGYHLTRTLSAQLAYSYAETYNRTPGAANQGKELARRPRHAATLSADWAPSAVRFGADLRLVSRSFDDAANTVRLGGYATLDLRASWQVSDRIALFGRAENVTDTQYQTAAGYGTAGRGLFVGVRVRR